jgi:hypothetical protein
MSNDVNDQLILIGGFSAGGKSASLRNIQNQERWMYLNTEAGKRLPFKNQFQSFRISDPYQVHEAFDHATNNIGDFNGIVVDSVTFMMDMFESQYIRTATNTQKAWGDFSDFFKVLMLEKVVNFGKPVIMTAHILDTLDEKAMEMKTSVPVKGSLKNNGVESYFSTVVEALRMTMKELEPFKGNGLLNISDDDEMLGYKHCFQTRPTKTTVGKRIRSPMGMFTPNQTYMDNDAQILLDHLHAFYG